MSETTVLKTRSKAIDLSRGTVVAGILNVTPDSFSDGGSFIDPDRAIERAIQMVDEGAGLIDVGACSTRPGSDPVGADEELRRLLPVIKPLAQEIDIPISIDTWHERVFRECFEAGADILNDVTALQGDENMASYLGESQAPAILMHMQGDPKTMQDNPQYGDVVEDIKSFFSKVMARAERFGVLWDQIVLDPGIGFGKTLDMNLDILRRIDEFQELNRPLLVGTSRKSFLGTLLDRADPKDREHGTTATTAYLRNRVQFLRVHDVQANVDVLRVLDQLDEKKHL